MHIIYYNFCDRDSVPSICLGRAMDRLPKLPFVAIIDNIGEALTAASNGDTIQIIWEGQHSIYPEHVAIDKQIMLTTDWDPITTDYEYCPMIISPYTPTPGTPTPGTPTPTPAEIIAVTEDNACISKLRIQRSPPLPTASPSDETDMTSEAGIRITASGCTVDRCQIQKCRVGILIDGGLDNQIEFCEIGDLREQAEWHGPNPGAHPGNFFGVVQIEPSRYSSSYPVGSYHPNEIVNCKISRNRYYGIVLRGGSLARVRNNLIVWNGNFPTT